MTIATHTIFVFYFEFCLSIIEVGQNLILIKKRVIRKEIAETYRKCINVDNFFNRVTKYTLIEENEKSNNRESCSQDLKPERFNNQSFLKLLL
jgi:hypothetical protein